MNNNFKKTFFGWVITPSGCKIGFSGRFSILIKYKNVKYFVFVERHDLDKKTCTIDRDEVYYDENFKKIVSDLELKFFILENAEAFIKYIGYTEV